MGKTKTTETKAAKAGPSHKGLKLNTWAVKDPATGKTPLQQAWESLQSPNNTLSKTALAKLYGIPKNTFTDRCRVLEQMVRDGEDIHPGMYGVRSGGNSDPRVFSPKEELEIENYIISMSTRGFPLVAPEVREVAHEFGQSRGRNVMAGAVEMSVRWQRKFMERHPSLSMAKPKPMSLHRACAGSEEHIKEWFSLYESILVQNEIGDPHYIWNVDETGVNENPASRLAVVEKYSKTPYIVPGDKGTTTTILSFISAAGMHSPPFIIMKGLRVQESWKEYMPTNKGWTLRCSESGWITKHLFTELATDFVAWLQSKGMLGQKHLVILDGHRTHTFNLAFLETMRINKIEVLCLPPHCSHFLQPSDLNPFGCFKMHWNRELRHFNVRQCGKKMSKPQFFIVFPRAWRLGMTEDNIKEGFRSSGLWPLDFTAIHPDHFKVAAALKS
jgi:hypothetical protein